MRTISGVGLSDVQAVYSGVEGQLWELLMGQQIHIGGLTSSRDLANRAGIKAGWRGVDLCSCAGAGMRFLLRFAEVSEVIGVDATAAMLALGRQRCEAEGWGARARFVEADACTTGLATGSADFVWGEDAWCYVVDKEALVGEAVRLVHAGGTVAFTDWVEGSVPLTEGEAERFMRFMKFATLASLGDYRRLLERAGSEVVLAEDTGRFGKYMDLYMDMVTMQLTSDALRILGYDAAAMEMVGREMDFVRQLGKAGKLAQGIFVARKR